VHIDFSQATLIIATLFSIYMAISQFVANKVVWGVLFSIASVLGILVLFGVGV